jgi:hypothetical protein
MIQAACNGPAGYFDKETISLRESAGGICLSIVRAGAPPSGCEGGGFELLFFAKQDYCALSGVRDLLSIVRQEIAK